jgi:hypothetical protein
MRIVSALRAFIAPGKAGYCAARYPGQSSKPRRSCQPESSACPTEFTIAAIAVNATAGRITMSGPHFSKRGGKSGCHYHVSFRYNFAYE